MILNFKTQHKDGSPTYFIDKISETFDFLGNEESVRIFNSAWGKLFGDGDEELDLLFKRWINLPELIYVHQKIHSLREDIHDRWQIGTKIHFYIWARTKRAVCFGIGEVKAIQYAVINAKLQRIYILEQKDGLGHARELLGVDLATFVLNDGFESLEQFWDYFSESKTYKIIHWTSFKY